MSPLIDDWKAHSTEIAECALAIFATVDVKIHITGICRPAIPRTDATFAHTFQPKSGDDPTRS